jgi:hypothetical protein
VGAWAGSISCEDHDPGETYDVDMTVTLDDPGDGSAPATATAALVYLMGNETRRADVTLTPVAGAAPPAWSPSARPGDCRYSGAFGSGSVNCPNFTNFVLDGGEVMTSAPDLLPGIGMDGTNCSFTLSPST